jgi:hypothetical protein
MMAWIMSAWGWKGMQPAELIMQNAFGNIIFKDSAGLYWRICPEALACDVIAGSEAEFEQLCSDDEFALDWRMEPLVALAETNLGPVPAERCYCLKIPAVLGGTYAAENFATISRQELVASSGHLAKQIEHLPDGSKIRLRVVD